MPTMATTGREVSLQKTLTDLRKSRRRLSRSSRFAKFTGALGDVVRRVRIQSNHGVRDIDESPRAASDDNRGDPVVLPELADPCDQWSNRLPVIGDEAAHALIANHEVGRGSVLIDEQHSRTGTQRLHQARSLGGRPRCIRGGKPGRVITGGKAVDKRRDIHTSDGPAVLGTQCNRSLVGDHKLAAIASDMVINTRDQGRQQRGLAVITATDNQRHAPRNTHAVHGFARRKLKTVLQRFRRGKRSRAGLRKLAIARLTRQHRTVCHKPNQVRVRHCTAQKELVILQFRGCLERIDGCVHDGIVKRVQQILTDQARRLTPENAAAAGGQLDF